MARKPRIHYPGALYHVMVRGNNRENVLSEELQKNQYLNILTTYKAKIGFILYAYCIMDNHVHLLIEVDDVPLSKIMQRIQQVYTQWYNRKYSRTGHVFQQRYKALLCDKDSYLLQLIKYIHNNPLKANLKEGIEYRWSSHIYYVFREKSELINPYYVLRIFSEDINKAVVQYLRFMNQEDKEIIYVNIDKVPSMDLANKNEKKAITKYKDADEIIEDVCTNENILITEICRKTKNQKISDIRKAIVLLSEKYCNTSNKLLAEKLNLSSSMISKIKSRESKGTSSVEEIIKRWEKGHK